MRATLTSALLPIAVLSTVSTAVFDGGIIDGTLPSFLFFGVASAAEFCAFNNNQLTVCNGELLTANAVFSSLSHSRALPLPVAEFLSAESIAA